jgi:uncharacterized protein YkwD
VTFGRRAHARALMGLAASAMVLGATPAYAEQTVPAPAEVAGAFTTRYGNESEAQVVSLVNALRLEHGLAPLEHDAALSELARERSADMARRGYFSHDIPGIGDATLWVLNELPDALEAAENLGRSNAGDGVVLGILFDAWVASPGHRGNMLKPAINRVGIGVAEIAGPGDTTTKLVTQLFVESGAPLVRMSVARAAVLD